MEAIVMKIIRATALCTFGILASCGLSEKQCVQADWAAVGKNDGTNGRSSDYINNHIKSCAKHDIVANQSLWEKGRKEGLRIYCTPQSAYINGRNGKSLKNVCPSGNLSALKAAHDKGKSYYRYDREINDLEHDRSSLRHEIGNLRKQTASPESAARINQLRSQIFHINMRINHLELLRSKYSQL
jgi:hypothetical protein